eukprot:352454-Chlamydomonas_euryale.AAC.18
MAHLALCVLTIKRQCLPASNHHCGQDECKAYVPAVAPCSHALSEVGKQSFPTSNAKKSCGSGRQRNRYAAACHVVCAACRSQILTP